MHFFSVYTMSLTVIKNIFVDFFKYKILNENKKILIKYG
jgi:hypothetical protein